MKKKFSTSWKGSKQPRKQRKYRYNAPIHLRGRFLNAPLSEELVKKHGVKRIRIRVGDKVKVMRGKFKGKEGKVELVNIKKSTAYVFGTELTKKDGSKGKFPIHASKLMIIDMSADDKTRLPAKAPVKKD
jgi:large subunit ribosomal protein L24